MKSLGECLWRSYLVPLAKRVERVERAKRTRCRRNDTGGFLVVAALSLSSPDFVRAEALFSGTISSGTTISGTTISGTTISGTTASGPTIFAEPLNQANRKMALELLGPGTSSRLLSSPFPLGGWEGFEVGLSRQFVSLPRGEDFSDFSSTGGDNDRSLEYSVVTIGKGLYHDIDVFLSFKPSIQSTPIDHFSFQIRHQFWQSENRLFYFSGLIHSGTTRLHNRLNIQSSGADLIGTIILDGVSVYAGLGTLFASGRFMGGVHGITDTAEIEMESTRQGHQVIGVELPFSQFFAVGQVDRFDSPYYSIKLGYRK